MLELLWCPFLVAFHNLVLGIQFSVPKTLSSHLDCTSWPQTLQFFWAKKGSWTRMLFWRIWLWNGQRSWIWFTLNLPQKGSGTTYMGIEDCNLGTDIWGIWWEFDEKVEKSVTFHELTQPNLAKVTFYMQLRSAVTVVRRRYFYVIFLTLYNGDSSFKNFNTWCTFGVGTLVLKTRKPTLVIFQWGICLKPYGSFYVDVHQTCIKSLWLVQCWWFSPSFCRKLGRLSIGIIPTRDAFMSIISILINFENMIPAWYLFIATVLGAGRIHHSPLISSWPMPWRCCNVTELGDWHVTTTTIWRLACNA